jgi:hypothetical protein
MLPLKQIRDAHILECESIPNNLHARTVTDDYEI